MTQYSKDGQNFFEINDDDESQRKIAESKGYQPYITVTKDGEKHTPIRATADQMKIAEKKGYFESNSFQNLRASQKDREPYSMLESGAAGLTSNLTMGFDDELSGAISAGKAAMNGRDPMKAYEEQRNMYRTEAEKAQQDNPWSYGGGALLGGMAIPGAAAANTARLGKAIAQGAKIGAVQGAVQGVGDAKEMSDVPKEMAFKGVLGGAMGGAGAVAGRAITAPGRTGEEIKEAFTDKFPAYIKAAWGGLKEGSKDVPGIASVVTSPIEAIRAVADQRRLHKGMEELVDKSIASGESTIRKGANSGQDYIDAEYFDEKPMLSLPAPGENKAMLQIKDPPPPRRSKPVEFDSQPTDKQYMARMLMEDGPNSIKRFTADRSTTVFPGEIDPDAYNSLLEMGTAGRTKARNFNRDQAAEELLPHLEKSREVFDQTRSQRWNELHGAARKGYKANDQILIDIGDALEDASSENSTRSILNVLHDVQNMVGSGKGAKRRGLSEGTWDQVDDAEKFNRLQQARKQLYAQGVYAKQNGLTEAESIIQGLTKKIDASLKVSPEKVEADRMWSKSRDLDKHFFDKTEFGDTLDKYKVAGMLKNTDSAKRFRDNIGRFEEFINDPGLNPKMKAEGQKLLNAFKEASNTAEQQRALHEFRFKDGPTSAAIQRQTAVLGGDNSPLKEAIRGPSTFMTAADNTMKTLTRRYYGGQDFNSLSPAEKDRIVKAWFKIKKDPNWSEEAQDKFFKK